VSDTVHETHREVDAKMEAFDQWMRGLLSFRVALRREQGQWFALAEDFDITGMGESREDALRDMVGLLSAYLMAHFEDGTPFEQTLRPIPRRLRIEIRRDTFLSQILERFAHRAPRNEEAQTLVPAEYLHAAVC
jgi:hypothetical protein